MRASFVSDPALVEQPTCHRMPEQHPREIDRLGVGSSVRTLAEKFSSLPKRYPGGLFWVSGTLPDNILTPIKGSDRNRNPAKLDRSSCFHWRAAKREFQTGLGLSARGRPAGRDRSDCRATSPRACTHQVLLGVTGSGKTFTMANVIAQVNRPTLVIAPNKTLAAQLYNEFKSLFPENAVRYFVSYYDYYQPEAYVPSTDTYIEKDSSINDEIDKLRHSATKALLERNDVLIVASVSCIYGLGEPEVYFEMLVFLEEGQTHRARPGAAQAGRYPVPAQRLRFPSRHLPRARRHGRGFPGLRREPRGADRVLRRRGRGALRDRPAARQGDPQAAERRDLSGVALRHDLRPDGDRGALISARSCSERLEYFRAENRLLEAQRLEQRTLYDLELLAEMGFCPGIENYSRHLTGRAPGQPPPTLLDYFPKNFLCFIDESHVTIPQLGGMYRGDRSRKQTLVDFGFRLPSALDNRPLNFEEWEDSSTRRFTSRPRPAITNCENRAAWWSSS